MPERLDSAVRHYRLSAALAAQAAAEALKVRDLNLAASANVLVSFQVLQVMLAQRAVDQMLTEQNIDAPAAVTLSPIAFTTSPDSLRDMASTIDTDWQFKQLVASLVQEVGRRAEGVEITARPRVGWVRMLTPPSCSRCAILGGRFYRWSDGFQRHPGCDCIHLPTTQDEASRYLTDPGQLAEKGQVTGLSKAEMQAVRDGADMNQIVNSHRGGLRTVEFGGHQITTTTEGTTRRGVFGGSDFAKSAGSTAQNVGRRGAVANYTVRTTNRARLSVGEIYDLSAGDRAQALRLLGLYGYVL